jgi:hypothetical protein
MKLNLLNTLCLAAVLWLGSVILINAEPVYLKSGKVIQADKVEAMEHNGTLRVYVRNRALRQGTWQPGGNAKMDENFNVSTYSISELADESIKRYFPKRWTQMQGGGAGAQQASPSVTSDKDANVSIIGARVKWGVITDISVTPSREIRADYRVFEAKVKNISGREMWRVNATLTAGNFTKPVTITKYMTKNTTVAFEIKLGHGVDLTQDDTVLTVTCQWDVAVDDDRRETGTFKFKVRQQPNGDCVLTPMD